MPIRRRAATACSPVSGRPMSRSQSLREIVRVTGSRCGGSQNALPCILTRQIRPPRSASAVATMFRQVSTAFQSKPVTSMNRFRVAVVTAVSAPLMIGGKESTCPSASVMRGYFSQPSSR